MARKVTSSSKSAGVTLGDLTRICVLCGSESMVMREHFTTLHDAMVEAHGEVDVLTFDGQTAGLSDVMDELRSFGLMQQYKLVVVDEADQFVSNHRAVLERYAAEPVDHASLVLRAGRWHRGKLDKLIAKVGCVIKCEALKPAAVKGWLIDRASGVHGCKLGAAGATMLVERLGHDLGLLDSEVAKLAVMSGQGGAIELTMIEQLTGRSSDEQAWAVQGAVLDALASGDGGAAIGKIHDLVDLAKQADVLVAYFVADMVRKLNIGMMMRRQGAAPGQIGSVLKLWGPRQAAFMAAMGRLDEQSVAGLFDRIMQLDARSKSGFGQAMRNIECFCAAMPTK